MAAADKISGDKITSTSEIPDGLMARILRDVFAYRRQHEGRVHIVKASGKIVDNPDIRHAFAAQVVAMRRDLGLKVAVVHGAGKQIDKALADAGHESVKKDGLRITNAAHVEIIDAVAMAANRTLCDAFREASFGHARPVGLAGHDNRLGMTASPMDPRNDNFSGEKVDGLDPFFLRKLMKDSRNIPVITNMCGVESPANDVTKINVNADAVASALAVRMKAHRLLMCSDVPGVLDENGKVIPEILGEDLDGLAGRGVLKGGMLVKVKEAFATASRMGPDSGVVIMDENFLMELLTHKGHGTMVRGFTPGL